MGSQQHLRGQKAIDADLGICQLQVAGRFIVAMVGANLGPHVTDCGLRQPQAGPAELTVAANVPEIRSTPDTRIARTGEYLRVQFKKVFPYRFDRILERIHQYLWYGVTTR